MTGFDLFRKSVGRQTTERLRGWQVERTPDSPQYIAATVELSRRDEVSSDKRFWAGYAIVALALILGTVTLIRHWW